MASTRSLLGLVGVLAALACALRPGLADDGPPVVNLGFLLPFPDGDSAVPQRLATEWISATKVALQVLADKYQGFRVNVVKENSRCDRNAAREGAQRLLDAGVVGVMGCACSEAALGALEVLGPANVPLVSFGATAQELGSEKYPTFFRTAFPDQYQAAAVVSVVQFFSMRHIYLFATKEAYGSSLATLITDRAKDANIEVAVIEVEYGREGVDYSSYFRRDGDLIQVDDQTMAVLATTPRAAEGLWRAAADLGLMSYPWWFLGTDGATAFDLVGQGDNMTSLLDKMQGQIGLEPYKGDFNMPRSPLTPFYDFWRGQSYQDYPGLLTLDTNPRLEHPRTYVTNIIDAVWAFHEAFYQILQVQKQSEVRPDAVLQCLADENCLNVKMTTGQVSFRRETGERNTDKQVPQYSFVNMVGITWEGKGRYALDDRGLQIRTESTNRPGPIPEGSTKFKVAGPAPPLPEGVETSPYINFAALDYFNIFHSPSNETTSSVSWSAPGISTAGIALISLACVAAVVGVVLGGMWLHKRRQEQKALAYQQFVHVLPEPYMPSFPLFTKV